MSKVNKQKIVEATKLILEAIGENVNRDGLIDTPNRVAKAWEEMMSGYFNDSREILKKTFADIETNNSEITLNDIPIYSFCEHHLLPFFGTATITYKPQKGSKIAGLSKFNRLVKNISQRLQTQERITYEIGKTIYDELKPEYVIVNVKCRHMCIEMRGIQHSGSETITVEKFGDFND